MKQLIHQLIAMRDDFNIMASVAERLQTREQFAAYAAVIERAERVLIHIDNTPAQPVGNNDARRPLKLVYADELEKILQS